MAITLTCACGRRLQIGDEHAGSQGRCPACGEIIDIPAPDIPPVWPESTSVQSEAPECLLPPLMMDSGDQAAPEYREPNPLSMPRRSQGDNRVAKVVLGILAVAGVVLAVLGYRWGWFGNRLGDKIQVTAVEEVYYKDVSLEQARRLGETLQELGHFDGKGAKTVQLSWKDNRYVLTVVVKEGIWDNQQAIGDLQLLSRQLSGMIFEDKSVQIHLCDQDMKVRKTLEPSGESLGKRMTFGKTEDIYYREATEEEARKVGEIFKQIGYFTGDNYARVVLSREGDAIRVGIMVAKPVWETPELIPEFRGLALDLSQKVFQGKPVEVQLCDELLVVQKSIQ